MDTFNFIFKSEVSKSELPDYVMFQSGKGRNKESKVYLHTVGFSYIEGLIWDKYREFRRQKKDKIPSHEWERILAGFQVALEQLNNNQLKADLKEVLKFEIINPVNPLKEVEAYTTDLSKMISELTSWLENQVKTEKYVYIMKSQ